MRKIIAEGAEAIVYLEGKKIVKDRVQKKYRLKELDEKIRKTRTRKERKLMLKAAQITDIPKILDKEELFKIEMEYIEGDKLSEKLDSFKKEKQFEVMKTIGENIGRLHKEDIIHGDLTTSNTILKDKRVYLLDFGLGFISKRMEDKAVDLHLIKQALEAKHWRNHTELFTNLLEGYAKGYSESERVLEQLKKVEARGRYKKH